MFVRTQILSLLVTASSAEVVALFRGKEHADLSENLFEILAPEINVQFSFHHHVPQFLFVAYLFLMHQIYFYARVTATVQGNAFRKMRPSASLFRSAVISSAVLMKYRVYSRVNRGMLVEQCAAVH